MSGFVKIHIFRKLIIDQLSVDNHFLINDQEMIIYWGLVAGRCVGWAIDLGGSGETVRAKRHRLGVDWLAEGKMWIIWAGGTIIRQGRLESILLIFASFFQKLPTAIRIQTLYQKKLNQHLRTKASWQFQEKESCRIYSVDPRDWHSSKKKGAINNETNEVRRKN